MQTKQIIFKWTDMTILDLSWQNSDTFVIKYAFFLLTFADLLTLKKQSVLDHPV